MGKRSLGGIEQERKELDVYFGRGGRSMNIGIYQMSLGFDNCYVLRGQSCILIDGGSPGQGDKFRSNIQKLAMKPEEIKLIILTHGHWDHVGSAAQIKGISGARIAMHRREKDMLEKSLQLLPPGRTLWGQILVWFMSLIKPLIHITPVKVDILLGDEDVSLAEYGIAGRIIHTPGHSAGSVSVLLNSGEAFVGDLAMAGFPLRCSPDLPILAENMEQVRKSWRKLLNAGAETIYPAHGKSFPAEIIRRALC